MPPSSTSGASTGDQVTPNRSLEMSTHRCTLNQFLHEAGIWSSSGRTAAQPTSNARHAAGHVEAEAEVDAFLGAHRELVHGVDDLHVVEAVHDPHFAQQALAARGVGFDEQRGDQRAALLDADAGRAVALQVLEVGAGQVEVIVQGGGGFGIDQLPVQQAAEQARDAAGALVNFHGEVRVRQGGALRLHCAAPRGRAGFDPEPPGREGRHVGAPGTPDHRWRAAATARACRWRSTTRSPAADCAGESVTRPVRCQEEVLKTSTSARVKDETLGSCLGWRLSRATARDCLSASRAKACFTFHWSRTKGRSGSLMLLWAPQVCSL